MTLIWRRAAVGLTLMGAGLATVSLVSSSRASDHQDSDVTTANPTVDIADIFAFMRPADSVALDAGTTDAGHDGGDAGRDAGTDAGVTTTTVGTHMIMIMTVNPKATTTTTFDSTINYDFNIGPVIDPSMGTLENDSLQTSVECVFNDVVADSGTTNQGFTCTANGYPFAGTTNTVSGASTDPIRVWAGLRSDPAFGDTTALATTLQTGHLAFADAGAGVNAFAGQNVLAIVADIDTSVVVVRNTPTYIQDDAGNDAGEVDGGFTNLVTVTATTVVQR